LVDRPCPPPESADAAGVKAGIIPDFEIRGKDIQMTGKLGTPGDKAAGNTLINVIFWRPSSVLVIVLRAAKGNFRARKEHQVIAAPSNAHSQFV
jgi:hypothetical protein